MIQYINKLQDKQVKVKILQQVINKVSTSKLIVYNYNLRVYKDIIDLEGEKYEIELYISSRHVMLRLKSKKYVAYFVEVDGEYDRRWDRSMDLWLCFTPSKEDLYNIFFKT